MALYIPFLSTDRLRRSHSATGSEPQDSSSHTAGDKPVVTVASRGQALHIAHLSRAAYEQGIRPGQTLADAKAMVPDIVTCDDDPSADRGRLESLAIWAGCLSPVVHIEGDDTLIADVTGCEQLFKGEANLLSRAIEGLEAQGFAARGAIADTPGGAWAIAHAHSEPAVVAPPGQTAAELVALPVWSLRIDPKTAASLASVGVQTIASLLYLPRSSLASRFGEALLDRIDQALGDLPEVLTPYKPPSALTSKFHLGTATVQIDRLTEAIRLALKRFCKQLERRVGGVRQMFVTFYCPDVITEDGSQTRRVTLQVSLSRPTRSAKHLFSLLTVLLDNLHLPAPADSLTLWAREIDSLDGRQEELFATDSGHAWDLGDLLDRLAVRLGPEAVACPELLSEHQPELAFRYVSLVGAKLTSPSRAAGFPPDSSGPGRGVPDESRAAGFSPRGATVGREVSTGSVSSRPGAPGKPAAQDDVSPRRLKPAAQRGVSTHVAARSSQHDVTPAGPRPLRLSPRAVEIAVTALVPEGPPIAFRFSGTQHTVVSSIGPERIETGWWRGPHLQRDYYRVATQSGRHAWLFRRRDTNQWFLHGWFD